MKEEKNKRADEIVNWSREIIGDENNSFLQVVQNFCSVGDFFVSFVDHGSNIHPVVV